MANRRVELLSWGLDDDLVTVILVASLLSIYFSYAITRVSQGAPRAWYVIIAAFTVSSVYRGVQLYFDIQSPESIINDGEALISLIASVTLLAGLVMLNRSFRRSLEASRGG